MWKESTAGTTARIEAAVPFPNFRQVAAGQDREEARSPCPIKAPIERVGKSSYGSGVGQIGTATDRARGRACGRLRSRTHRAVLIRDDIVQSIFVAMLEGSLRRDDVRSRVQEFVAAHNLDANKHGTGKYGLRSIDAPAFAESSTTFGDTISRGLWD
jgi:hypothetical protein